MQEYVILDIARNTPDQTRLCCSNAKMQQKCYVATKPKLTKK